MADINEGINEVNNKSVISLEPFIHQVGGRSTLLVFGQTICKPINSRELTFYEIIPQELKPFVPIFYGLIEIECNENSEGYLTITASPPNPPNSYKQESNCQQKTKYRIRLCKANGDILIESSESDLSLSHIHCNHFFEDGFVAIDSKVPKVDNNITKIHNPWVQRTISSLKESENHKRRKFLSFENLTSKFKYPCVMDIKMGTRQYDDRANESKVQSHSVKVAKTTSGALGLRITGIQVYNESLGKFICHNKYYGRTLTPEGFINSLKTFLQIETKRQNNLISLLVKRLEELLSIVSTLDTFRFYTTSILILYEGNTDDFNANTVDIRMIDFAHTEHSSGLNPGPDKGFMFGLNNLIKLLRNIDSKDFDFNLKTLLQSLND